jgi:hypothetical protein
MVKHTRILEVLGVDEVMIMLQWILETWDVKAQT